MSGGWTPGPWKAEYDGEWWMVYSKMEHSVRDFEGHDLPVVNMFHGGYDFSDLGFGTLEANARLIAAAPELYEALALLFEDGPVDVALGGNPQAIEQVEAKCRAALAKARGESA